MKNQKTKQNLKNKELKTNQYWEIFNSWFNTIELIKSFGDKYYVQPCHAC